MIQSMTGYGKTVLQLETKKVTIEVKSLNSKNLDLNVRIPAYYREKELEIRKKLARSLERGKIDFSIYIEETGEKLSTKINHAVVNLYIDQLREIVNGDETELLKMALRMPDTLKTEREELDQDEWKHIEATIAETVTKIVTYRADEGSVLAADFVKRIMIIRNILQEIIAIDPDRITAVKERLQKGIQELKTKVDENRFEQELVYYIEKYDITEEKVRLENHLDYFMKELEGNGSNGKKLGFISQEIGREINTIGSKANYAPMQKMVVEMKDELEKIKEQNLNVL
ncbi:MAG: YicC family protein [Flavobacteriaceae bacterium]|nr:MAG: YicC family protein [Flavobacteriaceae bacterium]